MLEVFEVILLVFIAAACFGAIIQLAVVNDVFATRRDQWLMIGALFTTIIFSVVDLYVISFAGADHNPIFELVQLAAKFVLVLCLSRVVGHAEYLIDHGRLGGDAHETG